MKVKTVGALGLLAILKQVWLTAVEILPAGTLG